MGFVRCESCGQVCRGGERCPARIEERERQERETPAPKEVEVSDA